MARKDRAVDTDSIHGSHHLVAADRCRSRDVPEPRAAGVIALVGMYLDICRRHVISLPSRRASNPRVTMTSSRRSTRSSRGRLAAWPRDRRDGDGIQSQEAPAVGRALVALRGLAIAEHRAEVAANDDQHRARGAGVDKREDAVEVARLRQDRIDRLRNSRE